MIGTEKEMREKRCTPSVVLWLLESNRRDSLQASGTEITDKCIGSKCAQWMWYDYTRDGHSTYVPTGTRAQFERGRAEGGTVNTRATAPRGYCGLTGARE